MRNPQAGGAELINEAIAQRLARDGHEVTLLVAGFPGSNEEEVRDGYKIIRLGNRYTVYWHAYRYYMTNLKGDADLVIDEMNTIPFFCKYYVRERNILFAHQLCREIWFYQMPIPISLAGYFLEPFYLWLLCDRYVIAMSESTKHDMMRYGFSAERISVISEGVTTRPVDNLDAVEKYPLPTMLSLGAIRAMKRTLDQISAFEIAKEHIPDLQLKIAGSVSDSYGKKVLRRIADSAFAQDIEYLGCVDEVKKSELLQKSHLILVTSVKEGWGLIVTEANSQGTPAAVYDVDGLRDSVKDRETGLISADNTPQGLAVSIVNALSNALEYERLRENAWLWSKEIQLEKSYQDFMETIKKWSITH